MWWSCRRACALLLALWAHQTPSATRRIDAIVAAEISHLRTLISASRVSAVGLQEDGTRSADPAASRSDVDSCEAISADCCTFRPNTAVIVTDSVARSAASAPSAVDKNLGDRQIFKTVRDRKEFSIGTTIASRVTRTSIIPLAIPIVKDGQFAGMCAIGISLKAFADSAVGTPADAVLVDRSGAPLGGKSDSAFALPGASRIAEAIAARRPVFTDFGQNGLQYEFHLLPVVGDALFTVAAVPLGDSLPELLREWGFFAVVLASLAAGLLAICIGAERWVVRPLRYIQEFAGRVARGENIKLQPPHPWAPELVEVSKGINEMAEAITSREGELRSGLEQRDHMLREIHHRVKNNLQMISSLLNLQASEIRSPRLRRFFGDAQNRVLTLSILHRHLYERSSWSLVDFQQFISDLVRQISVSRATDRVMPRYQIRAPIMAVGPDVAIPVGLIVTEAVSSALGHDFSAVAHPEIRIEALQKAGDRAELVIEDNGLDTGSGSIEPTFRGGFGITLLRGLSMQLGGEATISRREGGGVRIVVAFPLPKEQEGDG